MSQLFKNKYRIGSVRLKNWNYGNEAAYFVTICTKKRSHYFGEIIKGELISTRIGEIAHAEWFKSIEMRPDMNMQMGEFVVMPDHIHGIIMIGENEYNNSPNCKNITQYKNQFAPQSKNLASIIRGYKSAVTTFARKNNIEFEWQTSFHEHLVRSRDEYNKISHYIKHNPDNWND